MSQDWDFYFCRVDNRPASIFVDLGISEQVPIAQYSYMAYLRIYMQAPRPDGLSSQEEFEALGRIEDTVERSVAADDVTLYVGRNTADGCRDFFFYTKKPEQWKPSVADLMRAFPEYKFDSDVREDPKWGTYLNFLYPSEENRERIQNRRTCESLEQNGDNLVSAREIDHWAYFPNEERRSRFISKAKELGFEVRTVLEPSDVGEACGVQLYKSDNPSFDNIDSVTLPLYRLAKEHGGNYDGWETQVVS